MNTGTKLLAGVVALGSAFAAVGVTSAAASGNVTVSLSNVSPNRTVTITDLAGNDLTTTGLSLGADNPLSNTLSAPFRVAVTDTTMTPSAFDVQAEMTNLYQCSGSPSCSLPGTAPSGNEEITSPNLGLSYPNNPLDVAGVSVLVAPLFNVAGTVTGAACATAATLNTTLAADCAGAGIPIAVSDLAGAGQTLNQAVSLAGLSSLPLVPQSGTAGAFTNPAYNVGVVPAGYGSDANPTALSVVQASENANATLLTTLAAQVDGAGSAATDLTSGYISANALDAALRTSLGVVNTGTTEVGDEVWDVIGTATQNTIIGDLTANLVPLGPLGSCVQTVASCVVGLTGTYQSFPILGVTVPTATTGGTYQGTLVFTGF